MAEANLFGINGITGVADTEASNKLGRREEKRGRSERKKSRECDDRELIVFWREMLSVCNCLLSWKSTAACTETSSLLVQSHFY